MGIIGATVFHETLGSGSVVNIEEKQYGTYIVMHFDSGKDARFALSDIPELFSSDSVEFKRLQQEQLEKREKDMQKLKKEKEREEKEKWERYKLQEAERVKLEQERIERIEREKAEELRQRKNK